MQLLDPPPHTPSVLQQPRRSTSTISSLDVKYFSVCTYLSLVLLYLVPVIPADIVVLGFRICTACYCVCVCVCVCVRFISQLIHILSLSYKREGSRTKEGQSPVVQYCPQIRRNVRCEPNFPDRAVQKYGTE